MSRKSVFNCIYFIVTAFCSYWVARGICDFDMLNENHWLSAFRYSFRNHSVLLLPLIIGLWISYLFFFLLCVLNPLEAISLFRGKKNE